MPFELIPVPSIREPDLSDIAQIYNLEQALHTMLMNEKAIILYLQRFQILLSKTIQRLDDAIANN